MSEHPSAITRISKSLFQLLNVSRKIIINLVFFTVLLIIFIGISSSEDAIIVPENSALVLNIQGDIVEQKREIDPFDAFLNEALEQSPENPEVLIGDLIKAIDHAVNDDRIQLLVLKTEGMQSAGLTKLRDIAHAIERFKESGKKVIAYGDQFQQDQYYLASYADEIWLNPNGWMLLDGYGTYSLYFKTALEKLSINQHIFRVGTFKSAVEPYMRDNMSDDAKEANELWLNDLWAQYKQDVAAQRKFSVDNFDETTADLLDKLEKSDGKIAQYALSNHWVDALKTRNEITNTLVGLVGKNKRDSYNHITFKDYFNANFTSLPHEELETTTNDKIAIVVAKGTILDGVQSPGTIGGDTIAGYLKKARFDQNVKAVVLRVDSPGGSAYASEIIRQEVELLKAAGKPVVASMGTYAASGGYWISASANKIIASPTTITGSIGIFGMLMTFEDSLKRLGIFTDGVGTTELAGFGITRPLNNGLSKILQLGIERGYQDFIELVAENRAMPVNDVDAIAQGRVWSGAKAKDLGLVDRLGNINDAIDEAAHLANLSVYSTELIEKERSPQDIFMENLFGQMSSYLPSSAMPKVGNVERLINELKQQYSTINQLNDPQGIYTYCLVCEIN